mgnify:CR=1 FL=1|jgi:hypothetical protein
MFHNPGLYKHLKAATKEASDMLHGIKSGQVVPMEGGVDDIIATEPSFELCMQYLTENPITEKLRTIQKPEERKDEARKMLLLIIKKYLGCPYITFMTVL